MLGFYAKVMIVLNSSIYNHEFHGLSTLALPVAQTLVHVLIVCTKLFVMCTCTMYIQIESG